MPKKKKEHGETAGAKSTARATEAFFIQSSSATHPHTTNHHTLPPTQMHRGMAPALRSSKAKGSGGNDSSSTTPATNSPAAAAPSSSPSSSYRLWDAFYVLLLLALPLKLLLDLPADAFGREPANARKYILEQLGLATAGFFGVVHMVNVMGDYCRRKQQTGQDLCKKGTPLGEVPIPESQGLAPGIIYLVIIIACQMLYTQSPESLANYNSSLLSICFMLFLGFVDDVLVRTCFRL